MLKKILHLILIERRDEQYFLFFFNTAKFLVRSPELALTQIEVSMALLSSL